MENENFDFNKLSGAILKEFLALQERVAQEIREEQALLRQQNAKSQELLAELANGIANLGKES